MIYKWETLKNKAIEHFTMNGQNWEMVAYALYASINGTYNWRFELEELRKEVIKIIKNWDVRKAKKLTDLLPHILPKHLRDITPIAELNDSGDWVLIYE